MCWLREALVGRNVHVAVRPCHTMPSRDRVGKRNKLLARIILTTRIFYL